MTKTLSDPDHHPPLQGVTLWLDTYDDIFSDFDPRRYESRTLSDDFLGELRRIVREDERRDDLPEFHLLIPEQVRDKPTEEIISRRLHHYFRKVDFRLRQEMRTARRNGLLQLVSGLGFLLIAGFISFQHPAYVGLHLVMVALEPAGWFFIWMGYDNLFVALARKKSDVDFHSRMTRSRILFDAL